MKHPIIPELLFGSKHTVFRSETLTEYLIAEERPSFDAWKRGEPFFWPSDVLEFVEATRSDVARGVRHIRVRSVPHTLSSYMRFEFAFYPELIAAGVEIRVVDGELADKASAFGDFYLFDEARAATLLYDTEGGWLGEVELDGVHCETALTLAHELIHLSIPFHQYVRDIPPHSP